MKTMSVTLDTSQCEMSMLNDAACANMPRMLFALDTTHFEMSVLNDFASSKIPLMSGTCDTSQSPIGPCGPSAQSPTGESFRH